MSQLLLYKTRANLSPVDLESLRAAGFVPLLVKDFGDVRVVQPLIVGRDPINTAALSALVGSQGGMYVRDEFAKALIKSLLASPEPLP